MATSIPRLTDATTVNASDETIIQQGGVTKRATVAELLQGAINVKHYGAKGDGATDDTASIQAALDSIVARQALYFPPGTYNITNTIQVTTPWTSLISDGHSTANIRLTNFSETVEQAVLVKNPTAGSGIFAFSMHNLSIIRPAASTYQKGLVLESCSNTHMADVEITGFPTGMEIRGGLNCHYTAIRLSPFGSTNTTQNIGLLEINASTYVASPTFFSHLFSNSMIAGGEAYGLKITSGDYKTFSNCYLGVGKQGGVLLTEGGVYGNYDNQFDSCYFDHWNGGNAPANLTDAAITVDSESPQAALSITDCRFGPWGVGVKIDNAYKPVIKIIGCEFSRTNTAFQSSSASDHTGLVLSSNIFRGCGMWGGSSSIINIADARQVSITGNNFYWDTVDWNATGNLTGTKKVIAIASGATVESVTITGNALQEGAYAGVSFVDFENAGTIDQLTITGNVSDNTTSSLSGAILGNKANSNTKALDWYEEGTWTPALKFGGAETAITYSNRNGSYTRIGNRVHFDCYFLLTSKGSAAGDATVDGLPFNQSGNAANTYVISGGALSAGVGDANLDATRQSDTEIGPRKQSGGNVVRLNDGDFANNSFMHINGTYRV